MWLQSLTRLQRRCYWLLESEDDIVLVHYLNIDKAKGNKSEDTWTSADADAARRPGFTVTSGGPHGLAVSVAASWPIMLCLQYMTLRYFQSVSWDDKA